jgi:hypothetical protein
MEPQFAKKPLFGPMESTMILTTTSYVYISLVKILSSAVGTSGVMTTTTTPTTTALTENARSTAIKAVVLVKNITIPAAITATQKTSTAPKT